MYNARLIALSGYVSLMTIHLRDLYPPASEFSLTHYQHAFKPWDDGVVLETTGVARYTVSAASLAKAYLGTLGLTPHPEQLRAEMRGQVLAYAWGEKEQIALPGLVGPEFTVRNSTMPVAAVVAFNLQRFADEEFNGDDRGQGSWDDGSTEIDDDWRLQPLHAGEPWVVVTDATQELDKDAIMSTVWGEVADASPADIRIQGPEFEVLSASGETVIFRVTAG